MSDIIFISSSGESLPIAWRMQGEGVDVAVYIHNPLYRKNYKGIFDNRLKINQLKKEVRKTKLVCFDITRPNEGTPEDRALLKSFGVPVKSNGVFGPVADKIARTTRVLGASSFTENIELDRQAGSEFAAKVGLKVPETKEFSDTGKAVDFLSNKDRDKLRGMDITAGFMGVQPYTGE